MRVDLHLHSHFSVPNGDAIKLDSIQEAIRILHKYKVQLGSFTDHNNFSAKQYLEAKEFALSGKIGILPGVELDVVRDNGKRGNVLLIFEETLNEKELLALEKIIKIQTGKWKIRIKQIKDLFKDYKYIVIPHVGKSDFCSYKDLLDIEHDAIEITNYKHSNYISYKNKAEKDNKEYSMVAFSDTHIWKAYPQVGYLQTEIEMKEPTFKELKNALQKNSNYIRRIDD